MSDMVCFVQLTKIDEAKRLVYGRAVQELPDRVGEVFDYETSKPNFVAWSASQFDASLGKSNGNIREMHKDVAAGIVVPGGMKFHDDERAIDLTAKIVDDGSWQKVLDGVFTGFSIGGRYAKKWEGEDKKTHYTAEPSEISLVDRPCVPTATFFEVQKADGTVLRKDFQPAKKFEFPADAKKGDKAKGEDGTEHEFDGSEWKKCDAGKKSDPPADLKKADAPSAADGATANAGDAEYDIEATPEQLDEFVKLVDASDVTIAELIEFVKKRVPAEPTAEAIDAKAIEMAKADGVDLTKPEILADAAKVADYKQRAATELKKIAAREDADPKEGKAKYGNVNFADKKNKKYPLDTEEHVRAAASYWGQQKNKDKYSAEDQKTISAAIAAAEKKFGIGGKKADEPTDLAKAFEDAAGALRKARKDTDPALTTEQEAALVKQAQAIVLRKNLGHCAEFAQLCDALCRLHERIEWEEEAEGDDSVLPARMMDACVTLCDVLADMVREECMEQAEGKEVPRAGVPVATMAMFEAVSGLSKRLAEDLKKYGARNSKADAARIQKMHDHAVDLGALCKSVKAEPAADLAKADDMKKLLADAVAPLQKALAEAQDKITKLEAQPMPPKIRLRAVAKGQDLGEDGDKEPEMVKDAHGEVHGPASLIKAIHQTGGQPLFKR